MKWNLFGVTIIERRGFTAFIGRYPYRSVETDFHNKFRHNLGTLFYMTTPMGSRKLLNFDMQVTMCFGVKEENSANILCECEVLASLRDVYLGSFSLEPEDIKSISFGGHLEL
jgi:hypothetical protein